MSAQETELSKIQKGIYSLGDYNLNNPNPLVVVVHPFFYDYEYDGVYHDNIKQLIRTYPGLLITLEEKDMVESTIRVFKRLNREKDSLFVKTDRGTPDSSEISWKELIKFIGRFSRRGIHLAGGLYHGTGRPDGCLGHTLEQLTNARLKPQVLEGLTFS